MLNRNKKTAGQILPAPRIFAPVAAALLAAYGSAASAEYVLKDGVSLTGNDPAVDIYETALDLTLKNPNGAALDKITVKALETADFTFESNNGSLKDVVIQGFNGTGTLSISNNQGNALESNYSISGFDTVNITSTGAYTYALRGIGNNSIQGKNISVISDNNAIRFIQNENASLKIENFDTLTLTSKTAAAIKVDTESGYSSDLKIIGNENSTINIQSLETPAIDIGTSLSAKARTEIQGRYVNIQGAGKSNVNQYGQLFITADEINFVNTELKESSSVLVTDAHSTVVFDAPKVTANDNLKLNGHVTLGQSGQTTTVELKNGASFVAGYLGGGDLQFHFDELEANKKYFEINYVFRNS